jgi:membrane fusion protein, multidrug efflux system
VKITQKLLALVGLVVLAGGAYWVQNRTVGARPIEGETAAGAAVAASSASGVMGRSGGPAPVEVGKVVLRRLEDDVHAVGSLRSNQGVMMRPEVAGRIMKIGFQDGQRVRRGQLLIQLDDTLQQAQLQQARAQAAIASTNLQRSRELAAENFLSQSAVDQAAANLAVAEAQVRLVEAQLARMRIVAPFDAMAGIRLINVGDFVKDGADLINLEDTSSMWLDFRVPERVLGRLRRGAAIEAEMDAFPGQQFKGQIDAIDAQIDANGRALLVRARIGNPGDRLKSGMFVRVRTVLGVRDNALLVPEEALVPLGNKQYVYKVVAGEKGQLAQREEVTVGLRLPGLAEVSGPVKAGDVVVTAGQSRLGRDTKPAPVRVIDLTRSASGAAGAASDAASGPRRAASAVLMSDAASSP